MAGSHTVAICENAALYGATLEPGEHDPRDIWDRDDAIEAAGTAFRTLADGIAPDGTQLADERESLLWGIVNAFDAQVRRPTGEVIGALAGVCFYADPDRMVLIGNGPKAIEQIRRLHASNQAWGNVKRARAR